MKTSILKDARNHAILTDEVDGVTVLELFYQKNS